MSTVACEVGKNAPSVCLFAENLNRLVSLVDMLRVYAGSFVAVGALLERCVKNFGMFMALDARMTGSTAADFGELIERIKLDCADMGLIHTTEIVSHHEKRCMEGVMTSREASTAVNEISRIYHSELRNKLFLHVPVEPSQYFARDDLLSKDGEHCFPSCVSELNDSGTCYALDQHTASVMHAMRALEFGLVALANEVHANSGREQWHRIIKDIEDNVDQLGPASSADWRERKEFVSGACKEFRYFKDAWRNYAMHAHYRYKASEAKRVIDHVIDFMNHLSLRLKE